MARDRRKRRRRRRRTSRFLLNFMLILCMSLATVLGATIFFKVESITVEGNSHYSPEEVISATGIQLGENLFTVPRDEISEKITYSLPYIQSISVKYSLPTGITLVVEEQVGMVKLVTEDGSWYMGLQGKLLEKINEFTPYVPTTPESDMTEDVEVNYEESPLHQTTTSHTISPLTNESTIESTQENAEEETNFLESMLPVEWNSSPDYVLDFDPADPIILVTGLQLVNPTPGQQIEVAEEHEKQISALLSLFTELEAHQIFTEVTTIHVHVFQYFEFLYNDRFLVKFPFDGDYSYKLRALMSAASSLEHYETGIMDLTHDHYAVLFTPY